MEDIKAVSVFASAILERNQYNGDCAENLICGKICGEFWADKALSLLVERLRNFNDLLRYVFHFW